MRFSCSHHLKISGFKKIYKKNVNFQKSEHKFNKYCNDDNIYL